MIVDTSALVAISAREPGYEELTRAIEESPSVAMSAVSIFELGIVLASSRFDVDRTDLEDLIHALSIETLDFSSDHAAAATSAYEKYGKGNHAARLNLGDCASYATAKLARQPLLFVGADFAQTDIKSALG